jgi:type IV pilus assembly protein PilW
VNMNHPDLIRRTRRQRGFTLVELMIAVALGMLVMIALVAVYLNVSRTNSEMYKTNGMIENGRFAIDVLNEDLTHAGFWGGYVPRFDDYSLRKLVPADLPSAAALAKGPCAAYADWDAEYKTMLIGVPVQVFDDALPTGCDATLIKDRKAGTDVLVVRHADTCVPGTTNCEAFNASKVYYQMSRCATEIAPAPPGGPTY